MIGRWAWAGTALMAVTLCVGCSGSQAIVRGQDPAYPSAVVPQHGYPVGVHSWLHNHHTPDDDSWHSGPIVTHPANSGSCDSCGGGCPDGQCTNDPHGCGCASGRSHDWYPTHYHWFSYNAPDELLYPPANMPAAVVQYPYYTLKGPDDFFLN